MSTKKKICLVLPALISGGMERVMSEIANYLATKDVSVTLILLSSKPRFFVIDSRITIIEPSFDKGAKNKLLLTFKLIFYLRGKLKEIKPYALLSFGSMYNSFVMIASLGLGIKTYLSDRSNPYRNTYLSLKKDPIRRHDGVLHFILKRLLYKKATGLIVQTSLAKSIEEKSLEHKNVIRLPNPIRLIRDTADRKENYILNVGRFIPTKQQKALVEIFSKTNSKDWKLVFAGDGPMLEKVKRRAAELQLGDSVVFLGNVTDIDKYYNKSEIFAFTSASEGFPNALGEALRVPLASISYDCVAGPSDLIEDGHNGFLVPMNDESQYLEKLRLLMTDGELRSRFKKQSVQKMTDFDYGKIMEAWYNTLIS